MTVRRRILLVLVVACLAAMVLTFSLRRRTRKPATRPGSPAEATRTLTQRLEQFGPAARRRWEPYFYQAHLRYPPAQLTLVGLKSERQLLIYARDHGGPWLLIRTIPILAASGTLGPKLREGDRQVPEGLYRIDWLNPDSRHILSMHINYPNEQDLARARDDGRNQPGSDIMIHGGNTSIGCLAIGDEPSADLFVLAADTGITGIQVILSPIDFRVRPLPAMPTTRPAWLGTLYRQIQAALEKFPPAPL